jgi:hypothetical protein
MIVLLETKPKDGKMDGRKISVKSGRAHRFISATSGDQGVIRYSDYVGRHR